MIIKMVAGTKRNAPGESASITRSTTPANTSAIATSASVTIVLLYSNSSYLGLFPALGKVCTIVENLEKLTQLS